MASTNRHAARPGSKKGQKDAKAKTKSAAAKQRARTGPRAALPASDDAWRRKLEIAKTAGVRRAKTKAQYRKLKARLPVGGPGATGANAAPVKGSRVWGGGEKVEGEAMVVEDEVNEKAHDKKAGKKAEKKANKKKAEETTAPESEAEAEAETTQPEPGTAKPTTATTAPPPTDPADPPVPVFFKKARDEAAARRAAAEAHAAEQARRSVERAAKRAERARMQKAMAKARRVDGGGDGTPAAAADGRRRKLGRESDVLLHKARKMMAST